MGFQHQQGLRPGNAQRIHHNELAAGIGFQQLFPGGINRLQRAGQLAGEGDKEQILILQDRIKIFQIGFLIQGGGHRHGTGPHCVVVAFMIQHLAKIVKIFLAVQRIGHVHDGNIVLLFQMVGEIAVTVCHENVIQSHKESSFEPNNRIKK